MTKLLTERDDVSELRTRHGVRVAASTLLDLLRAEHPDIPPGTKLVALYPYPDWEPNPYSATQTTPRMLEVSLEYIQVTWATRKEGPK